MPKCVLLLAYSGSGIDQLASEQNTAIAQHIFYLGVVCFHCHYLSKEKKMTSYTVQINTSWQTFKYIILHIGIEDISELQNHI